MKKWEVARYFIDAKKCVDSVWYIAENGKQISNIDLRKKVDNILREFYINCCIVLDETHNKKTLCQSNDVIREIYYERDKDKAHKDSNYKPNKFSSLFDLKDRMKKQLSEVYVNGSSVLPDNITLDFVPHDKELFRLVHSITVEVEERIKKDKYPLYNTANPVANDSPQIIKNIFNNTEDIRDIQHEQRNQYAVVIENGINIFEGLQERQDACIKINVLYDQNVWCSPDYKLLAQYEKLKDNGLYDDFGIFHEEVLNDPIIAARIKKIMEEK